MTKRFIIERRLDDEKATIEKRKKDRLDMQLNVKVAVSDPKVLIYKRSR